MDTKYHVNRIVYNIAEDFGGTSYFIDAAAVVEKRRQRMTLFNLTTSLK